MEWIHTLVWIMRGSGWLTLALILFVVAVYVHVPLQSAEVAGAHVAQSQGR